MMPEEIRPASINRPRRVRSLSREEREERGENRDRFSRELTELARDDLPGRRDGNQPPTEEPAPEGRTEQTRADAAGEEDVPPGLGRNLDITT
jgi:hypothetical protein